MILRVKDHSPNNGLTVDEATEMQHEEITLPQAFLEEVRDLHAHGSAVGRFLMGLLAAVDHAGCGLDGSGRTAQRKPVMVLGWKHRARTPIDHGKVVTSFVDGFTLVL